MYDPVASRRSAVWVEQLSIAAELSRPVLRTEEAAEWSVAPVWSRASSNFRPADRPNSSIDSRVCLPNSDAVSVTVCNVVKIFLPKSGAVFQPRLRQTMQGTLASIAIRRQASRVACPARRAETANTALSDAVSALGRVPVLPRLFRGQTVRWPTACSVLTYRERLQKCLEALL